jgi:hypothetical protein
MLTRNHAEENRTNGVKSNISHKEREIEREERGVRIGPCMNESVCI